jgi:hypothetical protein
VGSFSRALSHQAPALTAALGYTQVRVGKNRDKRKQFKPTAEAMADCQEQFKVIVPLLTSWNCSFTGTYNEQSTKVTMPPSYPTWDESGNIVDLLDSRPN